MEPAMPCATQVRIPIAKTATQKDVVSKKARDPKHCANSDIKREANESARVPKVYASQRRNHSHQDHVADRRFHSWHQ